VHARTNPSPPAGTAKDLVLKLAPLLIRQGLQVSVRRDGYVEVRNPRGSQSTDPVGRALNPGMRQLVTLTDHDGTLWWAWAWSGPARDAPPEIEPMVPAGEIEEAARRIGKVLYVSLDG
jgi:hypothetical protein